MQTLLIVLSILVIALAIGLLYYYNKFQRTWTELKISVLELMTLAKETDELVAKIKELTSVKE